MKRNELFESVKTAVDNDKDVILKLKQECNNEIQLSVSKNDKIAMEVMEFLNDKHGEDITPKDQIDILQNAIWWTTAMGILKVTGASSGNVKLPMHHPTAAALQGITNEIKIEERRP